MTQDYAGGRPVVCLDSSDSSWHTLACLSRGFPTEAASSPQSLLLLHGPTRGPLSAVPPRLQVPHSPAPGPRPHRAGLGMLSPGPLPLPRTAAPESSFI